MSSIPPKELENIKNDIVMAFENNISDYLKEFQKECEARSTGIPALDKIEELMDELRKKTTQNYLEMGSRLIESISESEMIELKKENTKEGV